MLELIALQSFVFVLACLSAQYCVESKYDPSHPTPDPPAQEEELVPPGEEKRDEISMVSVGS